MITRRQFFAAASPIAVATPQPVIVPVRQILDGRAHFKSQQLSSFWSRIWPEAASNLARCGIALQATQIDGEVRRSPSGKPVFTALQRGLVNFVITDQIPMEWDKARGLGGLTTQYRGHHLCMVALNHAHPHRIPMLAVNTCLHELLHVLMLDVFEDRPSGVRGSAREFQIDLYATRLWLFHDCSAIRMSAETYVSRLRSTSSHG